MVMQTKDLATESEFGLALTFSGVLRGMRRLAPVGLLSLPFGMAFRAAASNVDLTAMQSAAMSALTFSGAAQFASLDFFPGPVTFASLTLVALALNARHVIMGAALSPWVNQLSLRRRVLTLMWLSDANFADSQPALRGGELDLGVLVGGGLIFWLFWVLGTLIGAVGGTVIGAPETFGIDVVMASFFASVVVGMMATPTNGERPIVLPVLAAVIVSVMTLAWLPVGWNVIAGAIVGGTVSMVHDC